MAVNPFPILLGNLNQLGVFQFLFPFLLVLAIVYGVLKFSLGGDKKILPNSAVALISIIVAFFAMNYSGGAGVAVATFFSGLFGPAMLVAVGILVIAILLGLFGVSITELKDAKDKSVMWHIVIGVVVLIVFLMFLGASNGVIPGLSGVFIGESFWTVLVFLVVLAVVMWYLTKEGGAKAK